MKYLYFTSPQCMPCVTFGPIMQQVQNYGIPVETINVIAQREWATMYNVGSVPTIILLNNNGSEAFRHTGILSKEEVINQYRKYEQY